jgi:perosamine synthetase
MQVPFHKAFTDKEEIEEIIDTVKSGWLTSGPKVQLFEKRFSEKLFADRESIAVNSGTAALHLALKSVGLEEGDEVIIPCNTFVATGEAVCYMGAKPVLCDVEESTHNIDCSKIESLITEKTKAIVPVHFSGQPCDMSEIWDIAERYGLRVIEDAAHALPSYYKGDLIGNKSDAVCFSFYATKTMTSGEGGMVVLSDKEMAGSIRTNRLHGIAKSAWERQNGSKSWLYDIEDNGFKYNMNDIAASIGLVQLEKLFDMNMKRQRIAKKYTEAFDKSGIGRLFFKEDRESSNHLYVIKVDNRDKVMESIKSKGVGCLVHFIPLQNFSYYQKKHGYHHSDFPVSLSVFDKSISLPIFPGMTDEEVEYVIDTVIKSID